MVIIYLGKIFIWLFFTGFDFDRVECFTLFGQPFCNLEVLVQTLKNECTFTCQIMLELQGNGYEYVVPLEAIFKEVL